MNKLELIIDIIGIVSIIVLFGTFVVAGIIYLFSRDK